jgi:cobalt-zinc-cadmium resistance protein CzcA
MAIIIAALIPIFTLQRVEGRIFRPLALTYTFALLGALVLALTLVPALCAVVVRPRDAASKEPAWIEWLQHGYRRGRQAIVRQRIAMGVAAVTLLVAAFFTARGVGKEFLPELDEGDIVIFVEMPPSIAQDKAREILRAAQPELPTLIAATDLTDAAKKITSAVAA